MRRAALNHLGGLSAAFAIVVTLGLAGPAFASAASGSGNAVQCSSAGNCTAVGTYTQSNGAQEGLLLAEVAGRWQGDQLVALPSDAAANPSVVLNDLWCGSAGNCVAVGDYDDGADNQQALVLTERNGAWSTGVKVDLPTGAIGGGSQLAELNSVWCSNSANCVAVGDYTDSNGNQQGMTLTEKGGSWQRATSTPVPGVAAADPQVALTALDCTSISSCDVVGIFSDQNGNQEAEILVGSSPGWGYAEAVLPSNAAQAAQQVQINSFDCASATSCVGAGAFIDDSGNEDPLILVANGTSFNTLEPVMPANVDATSDPESQLTSVWCASVGNCSVVGDYNDDNSNQQGLLVSETNGTWNQASELSLPSNADSNPQATPNGLWCSSAGNCVAAGAYNTSTGAELPLLGTESHGIWGTAVSLSLPKGAATGGNQIAALASVGCAGNDCATIGSLTSTAGHLEPLVASAKKGAWGTSQVPAAPPTTAQLATALKPLLATPAKTTVVQLARSGHTYSFRAVEPGKLTLSWERNGVVVAKAAPLTITKAETATVKLVLTAAGKGLSRSAGAGWVLEATATFTPSAPAGSKTVSAARSLKLS